MKTIILLFMITAVLFVVAAADEKRAGEEINWQVISGGGTDGSSASYNLVGTVGQTAVGHGDATNYGLDHGYWQEFGFTGECDCKPGEIDDSPPINILDVVYLINHKYKGGPAPIPYALCNGDPNLDCMINILDVVYLINYKYKGGAIPGSCEDWVTACGPLQK